MYKYKDGVRTLAVLDKGRRTFWTLLCLLVLSCGASAQEVRIITFDAPGADTKPGDYNGTYP